MLNGLQYSAKNACKIPPTAPHKHQLIALVATMNTPCVHISAKLAPDGMIYAVNIVMRYSITLTFDTDRKKPFLKLNTCPSDSEGRLIAICTASHRIYAAPTYFRYFTSSGAYSASSWQNTITITISVMNPAAIPRITLLPSLQPPLLTEYSDIKLFGPGVKVVISA